MNSKPKMRTKEEWHKHDLELIESYRPLDDDFLRELFKNDLPLAQVVLRIITGIEDLELTYEETQYDMKRLLGSRSICLDVFGRDSKGQIYDLEIQRSDVGAAAQRARYHSSAIDVEYLQAREKFQTLPISYVIFITENDVLHKGRLIYEIDRTIKELNEPFNDGSHIIFVNGAYNNPDDTSELAKLVHDFRCNKADDMYIEELANKTRRFKETPEGVSEMCKKIEDMRREVAEAAAEEGRIEGLREGKIEGIREGKIEGIREGKIEGKIEGFLDALIALVKDGLITVSEGAKRADMSVAEFEAKLSQI